jgi:hypothetical protein
MQHLEIEEKHYDGLKILQGDVIPMCYGLFKGLTATGIPLKCLVLEYCGEMLLGIFTSLSLEHRYPVSSYLTQINCPQNANPP